MRELEIKDRSGVVAIDIKLTNLQKIADSIRIGKNGYPSIFGEDNLVISHPTLEAGGKLKESFLDKMYESPSGTYEYVFNGDDRILFYTTNEVTNWKITGTIFSKEIDESASSILSHTIIVLLAAVVISSIIFYFVMKAVIKPIKALKDSAVTISKGDLTETVTITSKDEIGQLGQAFNDMQESLRTLIQKIEQNAEEVASSAEELTANANQTSIATEKVAISIQDVASSADGQTISANKNAESLHELSTAILHIAEISSAVRHYKQMRADKLYKIQRIKCSLFIYLLLIPMLKFKPYMSVHSKLHPF